MSKILYYVYAILMFCHNLVNLYGLLKQEMLQLPTATLHALLIELEA